MPESHAPFMPPDRAERIRRFHDDAYTRRTGALAAEEVFEYLGLTLFVPPEVHPINPTSHMLGEAVLALVGPDDRVLDMGTGCGVNAILAASRSTDVLAVDVNPYAIEAARRNIEHNGVVDRVEVRHSDVFSTVDGAFDLIVFDPPFRWFAPRDVRETASTDENYRTLTTFFREARAHLTPRGRLLMFFGTSGDFDYLRHLAAESKFRIEELAHHHLPQTPTWTISYSTLLLTP